MKKGKENGHAPSQICSGMHRQNRLCVSGRRKHIKTIYQLKKNGRFYLSEKTDWKESACNPQTNKGPLRG